MVDGKTCMKEVGQAYGSMVDLMTRDTGTASDTNDEMSINTAIIGFLGLHLESVALMIRKEAETLQTTTEGFISEVERSTRWHKQAKILKDAVTQMRSV